MIEITQSPYNCTFTKNPATFEIRGNMQYASPRVFPQMIISCNNKIAAGDFVEFTFYNPESLELETVRLVGSSIDNFSGAIPTASFAGTMDQYAEEVEKRVLKMAPLNAFYTITRIGKSIFLKANEPISELAFVNELTNQVTLNLEMVNTPLYNNPDERLGYTMKALVYFEHQYLSNQFECVASLNPVPNGDSKALIDISGILNAEIESTWNEFPMPANVITDTDCLRRYYVEFLEYWDDEPVAFKSQSPVLYCHWGGVGTNDQLMVEPLAYLQTSKQFLTWWPSGKQLFKEQLDWLSWMNTGPEGTFTLVMIIYKNTGDEEHTLASQTLKRWESFTFPVGYLQNDLDSFLDPGECVNKWGFVIRQEPKDISPIMVYYLHEQFCLKHQVLYFNSFGVPETVMLVGSWTETIQIDTLLAQRAQQFNSYRLKPGIFVFDSSHQISVAADTCRLTKVEAYRLQSMLNSMMAFIWQDKRWIPVAVTVDKAEVLLDSQFTAELKVEMIVANVNDRSSFYTTTMKLIPVFDCGLFGFKLESNGITVDDYGSLLLSFNGSLVQTSIWDGEMYVCSPVITSDGLYDAHVTVEEPDGTQYELDVSVPVARKRIEAYYNQTGTIGFYLMSAEESASIRVDWGIGGGFETKPYDDSWTYIGKTVSVTGNKRMILEKSCFDDIIGLICTDMYLTGFDFQAIKNLQVLQLNNVRLSGTMYLNTLSQMNDINLVALDITYLQIGLMVNLTDISIENCPQFVTSGIDDLVKQIWELRKHFLDPVELTITGSGLTWSADALAMINGTGVYSGEGLSTDYSFVFYID